MAVVGSPRRGTSTKCGRSPRCWLATASRVGTSSIDAGHAGGGWPGTFRDVSDATDFVRELGRTHPLDTARTVLVSHSSGGYVAAWIAGRHHLPAGNALTGSAPLRTAGLVLLDTFLDPRVIDSRGVDGRLFCDEPVLSQLIGGAPESVPDQLRQGSPLELLPYGVPQEYVVSSLRYPVTPARPLADGRTTLAVLDYPASAQVAGDRVTVAIVPGAGHFSFLRPGSNAWPAVEAALVRIFSPR